MLSELKIKGATKSQVQIKKDDDLNELKVLENFNITEPF